jgi:hypothetical protein
MPRTTVKPVMALLAGVAFIGAAAQAEAGSTSASPGAAPVVLDTAALDSVTAGNFQVAVSVFGAAAGLGGEVGSADVRYLTEGSGNAVQGSVVGLVGAIGYGQGAGAQAQADTQAQTLGNVVYSRTFQKPYQGIGLAFDLSASIGFAASFEPLVNPLIALQAPPT